MSNPIEDLYPLSPLQQGMFFHALQSPGGGLYLNQLVCDLHGPLDEQAFLRAWEALARAHPILRTALEWEDVEEPLQLVLREVELPFEQLDLRGDPAPAQRFEEFVAQDRQRGFELGSPPLFRLALVRTADNVRRFVFTHHHLLLDGWSVPLLLRQLFVAYDACRKGQQPQLPSPRPFRDYIGWLSEQSLERAEAHFRKTLAGFDSPTPVRVAGGVSGGSGHGDLNTRLSRDATSRLTELCRLQGLTLSTVVQAGWALLLGQHADSDDVVFGTTVSGRPPQLPGVEQMVGLFINTLPVRVRLPPQLPVISWLQALQAEQLEARDFEYAPLLRIQRWSQVPAGTPLFESLVVFENYPLDQSLSHSVPGLEVRDVRALEIDHFPLTLTSSPGEQLPLLLSYDRTRFSDGDAQRLLTQLAQLLERLSEGPATLDALLRRAPEVAPEALAFASSAPEARSPRLVLERFEDEVRAHPDAMAVVGDDQRWSYRELDERANAVAAELLDLEPEERVALCLPRSPAAIASLLGILKSGAAFVVLDAQHPPERLRLLLKDCGARTVVTTPELSALFVGARCLHPSQDRLKRSPGKTPGAGQLAYVLYTSGTTGQPKGVLVTHGNLAHAVEAEQSVLRTRSGMRLLQFASLSFDASLSEIFSALLHGAELHLAAVQGGAELARLLRERGIQSAQLPPSVLSSIDEREAGSLPALELVVSSGEACPPDLVARWSRGRRFLNVYGPTEVTISATAAECTADGAAPPIGRPLPGVRAYVLDRHQRPSAMRVEGELYLGGPQVARGYLHAPELTAQRFVPDPFSTDPAARLYRTGDRVFWREDGQLQFVGRVDGQVKLRGLRIELGEIEAALRADPTIQDAVVIALGERGEERSLAAYVVAAPGISTSTLREGLLERLPSHLIPTHWVRLEKLPLTVQGKVDRRALPVPDESRPEWAAAMVPPLPGTETVLAGIWAEVLHRETPSRFDHFFELGGHSLLATQVVSRVRAALEVELPLRTLFEAPMLHQLAQRIEALREGPRAIDPGAIPILADGVPAPLSFSQERLWFLWRLAPDSPAYNLPGAFRLTGRLDRPALERSLQALVQRHAALRTVFPERDGTAVQELSETLPTLTVIDLSRLSDPEAEVPRRIAEEAARPFDLAHGPLFRATLLQLNGAQHLLLLSMHHIVADGWSTAILARELGELYAGYSTGAQPTLPPLPLRYLDFAAHQRARLEGGALEEGLAAWKRRLEGLAPLLELPTDHPRGTGFEGATHPVRLSPELTRAVAEHCSREGVTPFMTLLAGFAAALQRWTTQGDFAIGTPVAGRSRPELEGLVGFFVNTLALRVSPSPEAGLGALTRRVKETSLEAFALQEVPFEKVVEAVQPSRELDHPPLFQVMFSLQNIPATHLSLPGLTMTAEKVDAAAAKFDLTLSLEEGAGGYQGELVFNRALFEPSTITRLAEGFLRLLEQGLRTPERPLHELEFLSAGERQQLLQTFNATDAAFEAVLSLSEQLERQVERTPGSVAVVCGDERLSFAELDARANQLAHRLVALGAGPGTLVGVGLPRSLDLVVALFGVLKSGAGYLPLDPAYPTARLRWMLEDSGSPLLVTSTPQAFPLEGLKLTVVDPRSVREGSTARLPARAGPEDLAYAIYTSGSTGRPKAVEVRQRSVSNLVQALEHTVYGRLRAPGAQRAESLRVAVNGSVSFDTSVKQLFQLLAGHSLDVTPEEVRFDGPALLAYLVRQQVAVLDCTPSQLQVLIEAGLLETPPSTLRAVLLGGEAIDPGLWRRLSAAPGPRFFNLYGPTECTVDATVRELTPADPLPVLGGPIPNVRAYVLDPQLQPVAVGVAGELYLGGEGVARGYLGRPDATAERFVPDPFGPTPGARLYRTGDRARWTPSGELSFLGRVDHQVKIRGHRIELGEVEAELRALPPLQDAVALALEHGGTTRLVAYLACPDPFSLDLGAIRQALLSRLPEPMIPSLLIPLAALPLGPSGKVDRQALLKLDLSRGSVSAEHLPPRPGTEQVLAQIWEELLGVSPISRDDHFFERGGHSLLAARVVARVRARCGVELPLRALFEAPNLSALAGRIDQSPRTGRPPLVAGPRPERLPLSFAQQRLWFLSRLEPTSPAYHVTHALQLEGALDLPALERALTQIATRHEILRTTFPVDEQGLPFQQVHPKRLPTLDRLQNPDSAARDFAETPFDLAQSPPWRAGLVEQAPGRNLLVLTLHHILTDGWSSGVFSRELATLYRGAPLPPLTLQYADYALAQRQPEEERRLTAQLDYWRQALRSPPPPLAPVLARPGSNEHPAGTVPLRFSASTWEALRQLVTREGASPFMGLLAALGTLLGRHSGQADQVIGAPIAGRTDEALSPLIGLFVNTLALRVRLEGNPTFRELLSQVRATTLGAYAHQEVAFERVIDAVGAPRNPATTPLFQVLLVLQNTPRGQMELPGLVLRPHPLAPSRTKFDLSFVFDQREDGVEGVLDYDASRFDPASAQLIAQGLETLLAALVQAPDLPVNQIPLGAGLPPALAGLDSRLREHGFGELPPETSAPAPRVRRQLAPEGEHEQTLARLWQQLLGVDQVYRHDDFFELGGHSLLAAQLSSRVGAAFKAEVPLRLFFDHPVLESQASALALLGERAAGRQFPPVLPRSSQGPLALSFSQQRLWFLQQLEPLSSAYHLPYAVRLTGVVDRPALETALRLLGQRHQVLRTCFPSVEGIPEQRVQPDFAPRWRHEDLRGQPLDAARRILEQEAQRPFSLETGPLLRPTLLQLEEDEHWLLLTVHHIASDGWSSPILFGELLQLYQATLEGQPAVLSPLTVQYSDYAATQREWLEAGAAQEQLQYWKSQLADSPAVLKLPYDRPRTGRPGGNAREELELPSRLAHAIETLARAERATPFMVLLSAFQALLSRWSGQDDLQVGTPVAGRSRPEVEGLIGFFVNTLVLRSRMSSGLTFRQLLGQTRETTLAALEHQDLPFEQVVEALRPARDLNHAPLFQVLFTLQNPPRQSLDGGGLSLRPLEVQVPSSKLDLALALTAREGGFLGGWTFDPALFDPATIRHLSEHFVRLLESALATPDRPVASLPLWSGEEQRRFLDQQHLTALDFGGPHTLDGLFALQVQRTPDAVALVDGERTLSFSQLNAAAEALARRLLSRGVGLEDRVALLLERSEAFVVSMLATLKVGAAFVPVDPGLPEARIAFLLEDAGIKAVLSLRPLASKLPSEVTPVWVDEAEPPGECTFPPLSPDRLAYVLYTSGSTGQPKGVMVPHAAIANRMQWIQSAYPLDTSDAVLLKAPLSFDVSVSELFWPLTSGARLVVAPPGAQRDPELLAQVVEQQGITVLHFVPSLLQLFLEAHELPRRGRGLRHVLCGGEALTPELKARFFQRLTARLHQLYGPTEASIDATAFTCDPLHSEAHIPIGQATANVRVYVLDQALQPVPPGVVGELFLAGAGVSRGYLGQPALTAQSFLPDPWGASGARMYRTGDLGRWRTDGLLEFAGRVDQQVKVRGMRIELGEVEAVLSTHPGVESCAVIARSDGLAGVRLVAHVATHSEELSRRLLEEHAHRFLPAALVPSAWVLSPSLPLTPNGKVDRQALQGLALPEETDRPPRVAPSDPLEAQLLTIWEELLGQTGLGTTDDFFSLGGHSLLAVRLVSRASSVLGRTVPLELLFREPTVAGFAARLRAEAEGTGVWVPLQPEGDGAPLILIHAVTGHVAHYRALASAMAARGLRRPVFGIQARGLGTEERSAANLEEMARDYVEELLRHRPSGPYLLGGWSMGGVVAFEMARQLEAAGKTVEAVLLFDSFAPGKAQAPDLSDESIARMMGPDLLPPDGSPEQAPLSSMAAALASNPQAVQRFVEVIRSNVLAVVRHQPVSYGGRVILVRARDARGGAEVDHGWERLVHGTLERHDIPGDHHGILRPPHLEGLLEVLSLALRGEPGT